MTPPSSSKDQLGLTPSDRGLVILNYGDPAYGGRLNVGHLSLSEQIFLRIIAYLILADELSIPARYILESDHMSEAVRWATPLLHEQILLPERRSGVGSFEELARVRRLPELSLRRAEQLDLTGAKVRSFEYQDLSSYYKEVLAGDLGEDGGLRHNIPGALRGALARPFDRAQERYEAYGDGTPEQFVEIVHGLVPRASRRRIAQWAMARYYITPSRFDDFNVREIPQDAQELLVKGHVPGIPPPGEAPAPVEDLFQSLKVAVPADEIGKHHREYCEAAMEVRRDFPEAREVFYRVKERAELEAACDELSHRYAEELTRQIRHSEPTGRKYVLATTLMGTGASTAGGLVVAGPVGAAIGAAIGFVSSLAANEVGMSRSTKRRVREQPWVLAFDALERAYLGIAPWPE